MAKPTTDQTPDASTRAGAVPLESILCTEELRRRPSRPADYETETRALVALMGALADSPATVFQTLVDTILNVTRADSAGISLLTEDGQRFYWPAIAGQWKPYVGGGTPRDFGPCGDVLDHNCSLLFRHLERRYTYFPPPINECLLVPFYVKGKAVGTIWALAHDDRRKFDAEDGRVMASLGTFAASAYQALAHIEHLKVEVGERERAEAEVRELASGLEAKLRRLVEANVVGIVTFTLGGAFIGANDAFLRMVQYDRSDLVSGRLHWTDLTPPEYREADQLRVAELTATGSFQPFEKEYFRKDGSRMPVLLGGTLLEADGNEGVAFVLDLTEQKREEAARRYSDARYRVVVDTASDAILSIDEAGTILFANPATPAVFGYQPAELIGRPLTTLMPEGMRDMHLRGVDRYLATGRRRMRWQGTELVAVRKSGDEFPVEVSFGELTSDGHRVFTGFVRDISKRKEAEHALRRSEAFLAEGQRLGKIGTFSWRVGTDEITWSEQLYRIYELEIGARVTLELIRTRVHPEDVTLIERMVEQVRDGCHDFEWQYRLVMPDRSIKHLHAVARAIRDEAGDLEYIAAIQDITARRRSEEARDEARSELARVARTMSLGALAASIAHEINQPLAGIVTNAGTCQRMLAGAPPNIDGALETARRTIRDANRAADVIARLRALFSGKEAARDSVDLNDAVREVVSLSLSSLQKNAVVVRTELAEDLPPVIGDRIQLQEVIMNLLRNGADAMRTIQTRARQLLITTGRDGGDRVRVSVRDAGVGFEANAAERLFDDFYTTKHDGMGIGLSVSRSIIERHGGRLWAERNDGPGSTFSFSIPWGDAAGASTDESAPMASRLPGGDARVDRHHPLQPVGARGA